jgi:hypothetical protein
MALSGPAFIVGGGAGLQALTLAALVCFLPGWLVLARFGRLSAERPVSGLVVGMGLRLLVVLAAALVICFERPDLRAAAFIVWLIPCYLVALAVETREFVAVTPGSGRPTATSGGSLN